MKSRRRGTEEARKKENGKRRRGKKIKKEVKK